MCLRSGAEYHLSRLTPPVPTGGRRGTPHPVWPRSGLPMDGRGARSKHRLRPEKSQSVARRQGFDSLHLHFGVGYCTCSWPTIPMLSWNRQTNWVEPDFGNVTVTVCDVPGVSSTSMPSFEIVNVWVAAPRLSIVRFNF